MVKKRTERIVLRCAKELFAQKGYHQTSISDIIRRAGVARGTFYLYFQSKREIFDSILDELVTSLGGIMKRIDLDSSTPPLEQLRNILRSIFILALEDPDMPRILLNRAVGLDRESDNKLHEFYGAVQGKVESALKHGIELGLVRKCNTGITASCILGCAKEVIEFISSEPNAMFQLDELLDEILTFGLQGILTSRMT
ncbi:MAG: TetR/AcrR family transcriptional regulator [Candidatus Poribacteria bacterium]|nr:TetR/AcrR family transcriptional regulator [Candidatus Poribacteria bacterium]MDE0504056.1 TetR/AcrR family transcriptional regulator [Candidatus Poribacteria bacterium]